MAIDLPQDPKGFSYGKLGADDYDPTTLNPGSTRTGGGSSAGAGGVLGGLGLKEDEKHWNPGWGAYQTNEGLPDYFQQQINAAGKPVNLNGVNISAARGLQQSGRGGLLNAMQGMESRPLDSYALGDSMMRSGQQQVAGNMAAQMASAPGRYNPAVMRQAQMGMASAGQGMAMQAQQQAMQSAIAERAARDANIQKGYSALDQNDIARLMAEQTQSKNEGAMWAAQQAAQQGWGQMGMSDKAMEAAARRAYDQARERGYYGVPGSDNTASIGNAVGAIGGTAASIYKAISG